MDYRLVYSKPAEQDLSEIVRYIAQEDPCAAERVGLALVELAESPVKLPQRDAMLRSRPGVRKVLHAPYLIIYRVDEARRIVRVLRFWHVKRDPRSLHAD